MPMVSRFGVICVFFTIALACLINYCTHFWICHYEQCQEVEFVKERWCSSGKKKEKGTHLQLTYTYCGFLLEKGKPVTHSAVLITQRT